MGERCILHVDMDAFFASVEEKRRPELVGRPVVVGGRGDPNSRGVVSAASYEARKFGIHSAMPLAEAFRRCPEAVFLPVDFTAYREASRQIRAVFEEFTQIIEPIGLDEAFLDVSEVPRAGVDIARAIKQRIMQVTALSCSVGVAGNKLLAKIASDLEKPDGMTLITERDIETRIWPLPVRSIWGIGPKTAEQLSTLGIGTIADLAGADIEALTARFGSTRAQHFFCASRGLDERPVSTHRKRRSISRETTLDADVGDIERLREVLHGLATNLLGAIEKSGLRARTVNVKIRYSDFQILSRQISLPSPTDDPQRIEQAAFACLDRLPLSKRVRLLGVGLSGLDSKEPLRAADRAAAAAREESGGMRDLFSQIA